MSDQQPRELSDAERLALAQAEMSWNNVRAIGSTMPFEQYLATVKQSFPPEYIELVKSRDPYSRPT